MRTDLALLLELNRCRRELAEAEKALRKVIGIDAHESIQREAARKYLTACSDFAVMANKYGH